MVGPYRSADAPSGPPCPRCGAGLTARAIGSTELSECPACAGVWVEARMMNEVLIDAGIQEAILADGAGPRPPLRRDDGYFRCPRCAEFMSRQNFARRSGIIVDVCRPHGVWFDADELQAALQFLRRRDAAPEPEPEPQPQPAPPSEAVRLELAKDTPASGWSHVVRLLLELLA